MLRQRERTSSNFVRDQIAFSQDVVNQSPHLKEWTSLVPKLRTQTQSPENKAMKALIAITVRREKTPRLSDGGLRHWNVKRLSQSLEYVKLLHYFQQIKAGKSRRCA